MTELRQFAVLAVAAVALVMFAAFLYHHVTPPPARVITGTPHHQTAPATNPDSPLDESGPRGSTN